MSEIPATSGSESKPSAEETEDSSLENLSSDDSESATEESSRRASRTLSEDEDMVLVPSDPAEWNAEHIELWLSWTTKKFRLNPKPDALKFPKTGTELCELTKGDLETITGDQRSGELLAVHLAHLRHSATGHTSSQLNEKPKYRIDFEGIAGQLFRPHFNYLKPGWGRRCWRQNFCQTFALAYHATASNQTV